MSKEEFVKGVEAQRIIGCDPRQLKRLAEKGLITIRRLPGIASNPLYSASDCKRIAREAIGPATPREELATAG